jgi:hypothetical protein
MDCKSLAFRAKQDCESAESFCRSIGLRTPYTAQTLGSHPWLPVERMRSTQGRIYGGAQPAARKTNDASPFTAARKTNVSAPYEPFFLLSGGRRLSLASMSKRSDSVQAVSPGRLGSNRTMVPRRLPFSSRKRM